MSVALVLLHSLALGPGTWQPVSEHLRAVGHATAVPDLRGIASADPPFWPYVVQSVNASLDHLEADELVLVAHSNTGRLMFQLIEQASGPVAAGVFVDAALPARRGSTPIATPARLEALRTMAQDRRLPPWTQWWDERDVATLLPDPQVRAGVIAEQPRLPLAYYEQVIPAPVGRSVDTPFGYLLFGAPYDQQAADAADRGWLVEHEPGLHLHQLVDPDAVAVRLISMSRRITTA